MDSCSDEVCRFHAQTATMVTTTISSGRALCSERRSLKRRRLQGEQGSSWFRKTLLCLLLIAGAVRLLDLFAVVDFGTEGSVALLALPLRPWKQPDYEILVDEGSLQHSVSLTGSYLFSDTSPCQTSPCRIHFPHDVESPPTSNDHGSVLAWTLKGDKDGHFKMPMPNQDRSIIYSPVSLHETHANQDTLIFLADGHGPSGHVASEIAILDLPYILINKLAELDDPSSSEAVGTAITQSFLETDKGKISNIAHGGSTALLAFRFGNVVYLASAGDSIGVLAEWDPSTQQAKIVAQARRHKPADQEERKRIEAAGGIVLVKEGSTSRVVIRDWTDPTKVLSALAMSRCLGDISGKKMNVLTPKPTIMKVDLSDKKDKKLFLMVSSDGVTDVLSLKAVLQYLGSRHFCDDCSSDDLDEGGRHIIANAKAGWASISSSGYRDDVTLLSTKL